MKWPIVIVTLIVIWISIVAVAETRLGVYSSVMGLLESGSPVLIAGVSFSHSTGDDLMLSLFGGIDTFGEIETAGDLRLDVEVEQMGMRLAWGSAIMRLSGTFWVDHRTFTARSIGHTIGLTWYTYSALFGVEIRAGGFWICMEYGPCWHRFVGDLGYMYNPKDFPPTRMMISFGLNFSISRGEDEYE